MKKILALFLALALCCGTGAAAAVSKEENSALPESYAFMVNTLKAIGVPLDGAQTENYYNKTVTRGEFAKYILSLINMQEVETGKSFPDLPAGHSCYAQTGCAYAMGLISADQKGNIRPDDGITYKEAAKAAVTLLGYAPKAESMGGNGYLLQAGLLGITDGNTASGEVLTSAAAVQILYNTLLTKTADILPPEYYLEEGASLLESCHNLKEGSGLVTGNRFYSLSGETAEGNRLIINGIYYKVSDNVSVDCVGLYVEFFCNESNEIISLCPKRHKKTVIDSEDVSHVKADSLDSAYTFDGDSYARYFNVPNTGVRYGGQERQEVILASDDEANLQLTGEDIKNRTWDYYVNYYTNMPEGFYIDVYPGYVVLRGRSFDTFEWLGGAQYLIPTDYSPFSAIKSDDNTLVLSENENYNNGGTQYDIYAAIYNGNELADVQVFKKSDFENGKITIDLGNYSGCTVRVFTWTETLIPVRTSLDFE